MKIINKPTLLAVSVFVALGSFVFGYSIVAISMMAEYIEKANSLAEGQKDFQISIITTLLPIGAFLGTFLTKKTVSQVGERKAMIYLDIFAFLVIFYQSCFTDLLSLYVTRLALGLYLGISGTIIPAYLVSMSPPEMTGLIGSFNQLLITVGISVAYRLGMSTYFTWGRYIFFPAYFCLLRIACLLYFRFDSLETHFRNHQTERLEKYVQLFYENGSVEQLSKLRGFSSEPNQREGDKTNQYQEGSSKGDQQSLARTMISSLTGGAPRSIVMMGLVIAVANQTSGINAIIFYAKQIFQHIVDGEQALLNTYYLGLLQVGVTFISGFMINNYGRRSLMLFGTGIVVLSLVSAFLFDALVANSEGVVIFFIFLHIVGFSLSLGPITFIYAAEIMQNLTFVITVNWILTIAVSLSSEVMIKAVGIGRVFLFYGVCTLACLLYMYRYMIESKGLSREELVSQFQRSLPQAIEEEERVHLRRTAPLEG